MDTQSPPTPIRLDYLRIQNYRALHDVELRDLTPLTVLVGPNGSGKSTLMDALSFVQECFDLGLRRAWAARGRFQELRTRGAEGPIAFEMRFTSGLHYRLALDEDAEGVMVVDEMLEPSHGAAAQLTGRDVLAASVLGQLASYPQQVALRQAVVNWHLVHPAPPMLREPSAAIVQERLNAAGDNLPSVVRHLQTAHPSHWQAVMDTLREWVPQVAEVSVEPSGDGRLLLHLKDKPFERPIMARFASDGTLALLAYLLLLHDPHPPALIGLEEPENHVHPDLLRRFADECRLAASGSQVFVTTHSPQFLDGVYANEVWVLHREADGFTRASRAADQLGVQQMMDAGALLGDVWTTGQFRTGYPLRQRSEAHRERP